MIDAALWSVFLALLAGAVYFAWPRPPAWDPVLFHSMVLATLHRGELEGEQKALADWQARLATALPVGPRPPSGGWTEDPAMLGPDYDPAAHIGVACSWDALAAVEPAAIAALERRLSDVVIAWIGVPALELPHIAGHTLAQADAEMIERLLTQPAQRIVLATQTHGAELIGLLAGHPRLRDRVRALLFVGARFDHLPPLTQVAFDTEVDRVVPWFVLRTEASDYPLAQPEIPPSGRQSFRVLDLGRIAYNELSGKHLGRSLITLIAAT